MEASPASLQIIADLLTQHTGQQLTEGRRWRVSSALSGVFRELGISNVDQLVCMLDDRRSMSEKRVLERRVVEALLNNETYFFRDKPTFDQLPENVLNELAEQRQATRRLSIWCAGCSTGQEVYSIAMMFADSPERWQGWSIDILGTDISGRVIKAARSGLYSQFEVQRGLGVIEMLRHFDETPEGWQIKSATQKNVRFQQHNVLDEPPSLDRFDLILCRNVLLYFDQATRERAFDRLLSAISADGVLMLGAGETVVGQTDAFQPCARRMSLYAPKPTTPSVFVQQRALAG